MSAILPISLLRTLSPRPAYKTEIVHLPEAPGIEARISIQKSDTQPIHATSFTWDPPGNSLRRVEFGRITIIDRRDSPQGQEHYYSILWSPDTDSIAFEYIHSSPPVNEDYPKTSVGTPDLNLRKGTTLLNKVFEMLKER